MKASRFISAAAGLAVVVAVALAGRAWSEPTLKGATPMAPTATADAPTVSQDQNYRIGPLDLLDISVFQVDSLTRTVQVAGDGNIDLPLVGSVPAAGKTPRELGGDLAALYSQQGYVESPQVSVFVKDAVRRRFTVGGSVKTPGNFPLIGQMTLLQGIAAAGGADELAKVHQVVIFRMVDQRRAAAVVNLHLVEAGREVDPQLQPGDVVMVPESSTKRAIKQLVGVTPLIYLATLIR